MNAAETFWHFSLRVYGTDDVAEACLVLQEEHGADVNLLLYCCWLGDRGAALDAPALARALAFAAPWAEHVVQPLRRARRWIKAHGPGEHDLPPAELETLREAIKRIELDAERLQQQMLASLGGSPAETPATAAQRLPTMIANLYRYSAAAGIGLDATATEALGKILAAAADADHDAVQQALGAAEHTDG